MFEHKKVALVILDGWGIGNSDRSNAIRTANTPFTDSLYHNYPNATLTTHGNAVGLPEGQMGNSEVGHMNLGAGRVVWQMLELINRSFESGESLQNKTLKNLFEYCIANQKTLHLLGLLSDGGVHSSLQHLYKLIEMAASKGVQSICIHAFTDGRDTDPKSGLNFIRQLEKFIQSYPNTHLATVCGRYYAMDRDKRWERVKIAYDALVRKEGIKTTSITDAITNQYLEGVTDEFLKPIINQNLDSKILPHDGVLFFNFRTDRGRQLTTALSQKDFPEFDMQILPLKYATLTEYDKSFLNIDVVFDNKDIQNTLGEVISKAGLKQIRAAETEKYPHVTFFFSGGREDVFEGEKRILVNSPKVATYDLQPEMSALELTSALVLEFETDAADFFCINFANPDMVGHTGDYQAICKAVEAVDQCLQKIAEIALKKNYTLIVTADHGNADYAINEDGTPNTAHSLNPVPLWLLSNEKELQQIRLKSGMLADIAPTILKLMKLPQPSEMTGNALF
jgi:2,3-bisphosphoglycerate-independent phosphoglycerate mutase